MNHDSTVAQTSNCERLADNHTVDEQETQEHRKDNANENLFPPGIAPSHLWCVIKHGAELFDRTSAVTDPACF
jgi:hypothetical protein